MAFVKGKSGNPNGKPIGSKSKDKNINLRNVYEDLIGTFKSGRFYVYYHVCTNNKEVVYIGKGTSNRAWEFTDASRNTNWCEYKKSNKLDIKIVASDLSQEEALAIEKALIETKKPILNINNIKLEL